MISNNDVEAADRRLQEFLKNDPLGQITKDYTEILHDYRRLLSDNEDLRDSRDRYKQLARAQERNPFVVVLVDGDGYVFDQSFISDGAHGGSRAAQSLVEATKASLQGKGLEGCDIVLRIYANVAGLSKTLSRAGLATNDKRSIASFITGFNGSWGLGDFVDAGEIKENADFKLRACLQLYAGDAQCKHIYFAACHDSGYVSELKPYMGNRDKFTLVDIPSIAFHTEFTKLNMNIEKIDRVFRHTPLVEPSPRQPLRVTAPACVPPAQQSPYQYRYDEQSGSRLPDWHKHELRMPTRTESATPHRNRISQAVDNQNTTPSPQSMLKALFQEKLPGKESVSDGRVALNNETFRLDPYTPSPGPEAIQKFLAYTKQNPICNRFHLTKSCKAGEDCKYSHDTLNEGDLEVLEYVARQIPCQKRGKCRDTACCSGHICQNINCKHRGGNLPCKIPFKNHGQSIIVDRYVTVTKILDDKQSSSVGSYETIGGENDNEPNGQGAGVLPEVGHSLEGMDADARESGNLIYRSEV